MNAGPGLSEQELREAAAEAGISPEELRRALVERNGPQATGKALVRRSEGAELAQYSAETRLDVPPEQALDVVRRAFAKQVGHTGHRQGPSRADIVDDSAGVVYKIHADGDGQGGALVKVDVDAGAGRSNLALGGFILGGFSLGITAFGALLAPLIMWAGITLGVVGAAALFLAAARLSQGRKRAELIVAQALVEAEEAPALSGPPRALRPG
ncbi:hypothetical protein OV203_13780 [Nannocystis sp. ILAH1]|uniref:hypothetical protein n=1 Tax=unclassified Nannocystis TaxID=2627009 RepID=UPI00227126F3|nr:MULTISPECIES: hypothetical protein [unclassified Nannocystis]MCY0988203.1 hypothetical protein [Nannocystis sp. ILAH1]MCY1067835.1 hypothetical protein [Nannocystis sp. RBIL2]